MEILGDRKYVEIPGAAVHELPPLLLKDCARPARMGETVGKAEEIVALDELIPVSVRQAWPRTATESQRFDLAINLAERYGKFLDHWCWGESIVEWIRQCETTFETQPVLRPLLHPDIWPHAGRSSFVTLLSDKHVSSTGVDLKNAVGVRLTFRRPPPIQFFSDQFLFLLNDSLAGKAYETWSSVSDGESASLPPERFHFFVMGDEIQQV